VERREGHGRDVVFYIWHCTVCKKKPMKAKLEGSKRRRVVKVGEQGEVSFVTLKIQTV